MNGVDIDLTHVSMGRARVHGWVRKADAVTVLANLRERGLNATKLEEFHRAHNRFDRFWVIGRPDSNAEFTWLMDDDGTWARGRLVDRYDKPSAWVSLPTPERIPATFTHITTTVLCAGRRERYRTKSNGSCGRWVMGDDSVARCTCGWKSYASTRGEAQAAARWHRANPGDRPLG
ncbi:hypothetical protein ACIBTV_25475 [Micromonospora sp. NPDC049366]|uniref:hypothetical protein n=1 Tax=Micromonospora sp. NPDC049366 TaxID=3364271 RepID=UPI0037952ACB